MCRTVMGRLFGVCRLHIKIRKTHPKLFYNGLEDASVYGILQGQNYTHGVVVKRIGQIQDWFIEFKHCLSQSFSSSDSCRGMSET